MMNRKGSLVLILPFSQSSHSPSNLSPPLKISENCNSSSRALFDGTVNEAAPSRCPVRTGKENVPVPGAHIL